MSYHPLRDSQCVRFQQAGFCGHWIAVALKNQTLDIYVAYLQRTNFQTLTKIASKNVDKNRAGKKRPIQARRRKVPHSPEKQSNEYFVDC